MSTSDPTFRLASFWRLGGLVAWLGSMYGALSLLQVPMPRLDGLCGEWG